MSEHDAFDEYRDYVDPDFEQADISFECVRHDPGTVMNYVDGSSVKRVVVAGSRDITSTETVRGVLERVPTRWGGWIPSEMVTGGGRGVDDSAMEIARDGSSEWEILTTFEPKWDRFGPSAGPLRNEAMAEYADALVAVWDGHSDGTKGMIQLALKHNLDVYVETIET